MKNFDLFKSGLMKTNLFSLNADLLEKFHLSDEDHQGVSIKTQEQTILQRHVERVKNIDEKIIELVLKSEITKIEPTAGFLIEVFASGSDGRLSRMFQNDLVDLHGKIVEQGFADFLILEIDT